MMLPQPFLQLRAALRQFGGNFRGIATRLAGFNLPMHGHQRLFVILDIPGDGVDLCLTQLQGRGNLGPGPPGFEVMQDVPDGDSCSRNTVVDNHGSCLVGTSLHAASWESYFNSPPSRSRHWMEPCCSPWWGGKGIRNLLPFPW